ncbi:MAG: 3-dehydroquinate synthase [Acidobacteriota bacterium]|nr:3-dehydroquinate synthase [Blastocatellia bacterium]MDW8413504.1 3-dehydroquinate synthase [Acidobacteriota bacterium]
MLTIPVRTAESYEIFIERGLIDRSGQIIRAVAPQNCRKIAIITNRRLSELYAGRVTATLRELGYEVIFCLMGDGERFKTLRTVEKVVGCLLSQGLGRHDLIVALGGGVVGDLAGFVAGTFMRGVAFVQIPTTLLAQIDSSVGGKSAVNHKLGKNMIGVFKQPRTVIIDPDVLSTLPQRELFAAMYEAVKYALIADSDLFELLEVVPKTASALLSDRRLEELIACCCYIKADVVSRDERETGERKILNLGHTLGHALETVTGYNRFKHGEAVGYGIMFASSLAKELGLITKEQQDKIYNLVRSFGRLPSLDGIDSGVLLGAIAKDKKSVAGRAVFVLPNGIGKVVIRDDVPIEVLGRLLNRFLEQGL